MAQIDTVNIGSEHPNPYKTNGRTGIDKRPQFGAVQVVIPAPKGSHPRSGLAGDFIGDGRYHGGPDQALYAVQREDLDAWQERLERELGNGFFGENLTTVGLEVNDARIGEVWRIGDTVEVRVTSPRMPCATFRGWVGERGWLKTYTQAARPGAYLAVITPGTISAGDAVLVTRPDHDVTVSMVYRALTLEPELLPRLRAAREHLDKKTMAAASGA